MSQAESQFTDQPIAQLIVQKGPQPTQIIDLALEQLTIGRSSTNDFPITDPEISRKHARLVKQGTTYAIEDLGSTNGTFVNERRISGLTPLHDGDIIEFGEAITLLYKAESTLPINIPTQPYFPQEPALAVSEPVKIAPDAEPAPPQPKAPAFTPQPNPIVEEETSPSSCRRNAVLGCGIILLLIFLCTATLFFLDAYQQGRLLYCGSLQGFWELVLGPFGFAPLCQ